MVFTKIFCITILCFQYLKLWGTERSSVKIKMCVSNFAESGLRLILFFNHLELIFTKFQENPSSRFIEKKIKKECYRFSTTSKANHCESMLNESQTAIELS